jgi:hypothetical protein
MDFALGAAHGRDAPWWPQGKHLWNVHLVRTS